MNSPHKGLWPGEFPAQRPVARSFEVFSDLCLNKRLNKQSWGWWFETPSHPLWRHCNAVSRCMVTYSRQSCLLEQSHDCPSAKEVISEGLVNTKWYHTAAEPNLPRISWEVVYLCWRLELGKLRIIDFLWGKSPQVVSPQKDVTYVKLWCFLWSWSQQAFEWTVELLVIWRHQTSFWCTRKTTTVLQIGWFHLLWIECPLKQLLPLAEIKQCKLIAFVFDKQLCLDRIRCVFINPLWPSQWRCTTSDILVKHWFR